MDDSFAALVRGPVTRYPRGFPYLFPIWLAIVFGAVWIGWLRVIGPVPWWYGGTLVGGLVIAGITTASVLATIRHPAFRADRNGIRLGLRTERKRPRNRQAHLWWSDVRQLRIEPRSYGVMVEVSLGPAARIVRRRGPARQALLWLGMVLLPFGLGRGTPRLTEPRRKDPQYRVRLYDVTPEELGLALAGLALPAVEIIVISRRYGPIMARRPQAAAPHRTAPPAAAPLAKAPRMSAPPAPAPPAAAASPATAPLPAASQAAGLPLAEAPAARVPAAEAPAAEAPLTEAPLTEAPVTDNPVARTPVSERRPDDTSPDSTPLAAPALAEPALDEPRPAETPGAVSAPQVPVMVTPHADREAAAPAAPAAREAAQPAA